MIITVASFKGGVGKTTTAVHLAAYMQQKAPTLLIDGDPNRSATGWTKRGELPFKVVDERQSARYAREYEHIVIDTEARPEENDLKELADGCDLLIVPTTCTCRKCHPAIWPTSVHLRPRIHLTVMLPGRSDFPSCANLTFCLQEKQT